MTSSSKTYHFSFSFTDDLLAHMKAADQGQSSTEVLLMSKCLSLCFGSVVCKTGPPAQANQSEVNGQLSPGGTSSGQPSPVNENPLPAFQFAPSIAKPPRQTNALRLQNEEPLDLCIGMKPTSDKRQSSVLVENRFSHLWNRDPLDASKLAKINKIRFGSEGLIMKRRKKMEADKRQYRLSAWERTNFKCSICGKNFKHLTNVSRHKRMIHNATSETKANFTSENCGPAEDVDHPPPPVLTNPGIPHLSVESLRIPEMSFTPPEMSASEARVGANHPSSLPQMDSASSIVAAVAAASGLAKNLLATERYERCTDQYDLTGATKLGDDYDYNLKNYPFPIEIGPEERASLTCSVCKYQFTILSNLRRHKRVYGHYKKFPCTHCTEIFGSEEKLMSHQQNCTRKSSDQPQNSNNYSRLNSETVADIEHDTTPEEIHSDQRSHAPDISRVSVLSPPKECQPPFLKQELSQ